MKRRLAAIILCLTSSAALAQTDAFQALRDGNHVLLLRHAIAPGFGDPTGFRLDDCATQRNLSTQGLAQARLIGRRLRAEALAGAAVYTSEWCRCQDTAQALGLTPPIRHRGLNSFFQNRGQRDIIMSRLEEKLIRRYNEPSAVMVTHQVNIRALTGQSVRSGAGVVIRLDENGQHTVIATITAAEWDN